MQDIVGNKAPDFPLKRNAIGNGGAIASRLIPALAALQYGTTDTPITFTGDFEIPIKFASTDTSLVNIGLFGYSIAGTTNYLQIKTTTGLINFKTDDGSVSWSHGDVHLDGKIHEVTPYRVGNTIGIKLDGVIKASTALGAASQVDIDLIGCVGIATTPSQFFSGEILSAKFTDAGTVVANFVFDSGSDLYQLPRGEGLGGELVSADQFFSPVANNSTISAISDYAFTMTGDGAAQTRAYTNINTVIGKLYSIKITRDSATGGTPTAFARNAFDGGGATIDSVTLSANGDYFLSFTATTTESSILWAQAGFSDTSSYSSIHVNQLPDLTCLLTNFATTDWARYTLQRNITHDAGTVAEAWVGDNLVVNGRFNADTDWIKGVGWTIGSGVASCDGSQAAISDINQLTSLMFAGSSYLIAYTISNYSAGTCTINLLGTANLTNRSSNGTFIENFAPSGAPSAIGVRADVNFIGSVDNISAQHLLEVA